MGAKENVTNTGAGAPVDQGFKAKVRAMIRGDGKRDIASLTRKAATGAWAWLRFQAVEISKEIRQAVNPPVRVRRLPGGALAIVCKPEFGGLTTVLSGQQPSQVRLNGFEVRSYRLGNGGDLGALIGTFHDEATARHGLELISSALVGGGRGTGKWILGAAAAVVLLVFASSFFRGPVPGAATKAAGDVEQAQEAKPKADVLRDAFGAISPASTDSSSYVANAGADEPGESLADTIYRNAMAASQQTSYEAGPPQSPIENPQVGDFGLGVSSKEGCDPALKFTVASTP